ncbi:MAG: CDGSH iron-sulfur domain-containing protein [Pseudomonadota bacterium]
MTDPDVPQSAPSGVDVEQGRSRFWCACSKSGEQPFCDGSHKGSDIAHLTYTALSSSQVFFCGCKATTRTPLCDGSRTAL